jgi:hypothetical protein
MLKSTPFFAAFGPLLFGRSPRCRLQELLGQGAHVPSINQYMEAFGQLVPQTLLTCSKLGLNSRQRIFSLNKSQIKYATVLQYVALRLKRT